MVMTTYITNRHGETFTFPAGMITSIKTNISPGVDQNQMPISGPQNNQGSDIDGVGKTITITGNFFDATSSVTSSNVIRGKETMKLWFESIADGMQLPLRFSSHLNDKSVFGAGNTLSFQDTVTGNYVNIPATFTDTYAYVVGFTYGEEEAHVEQIPFTLTLWVAGL
jgi:hypothetical protein